MIPRSVIYNRFLVIRDIRRSFRLPNSPTIFFFTNRKRSVGYGKSSMMIDTYVRGMRVVMRDTIVYTCCYFECVVVRYYNFENLQQSWSLILLLFFSSFFFPEGAVWIYENTGSGFSQLGNKLVGPGIVGGGYSHINPSIHSSIHISINHVHTYMQTSLPSSLPPAGMFGHSVSLNSNGSILACGGHMDDSQVGAAWVFSRNSATYTQIGNKILGSGYVAPSQMGECKA